MQEEKRREQSKDRVGERQLKRERERAARDAD